MNRAIRDLLICVSFSNLLLIAAWQAALGSASYLAAIQPSHIVAILVSIMAVGVVFWGGISIARRCGTAGQFVGKWVFLQIVTICFAIPCFLFIPERWWRATAIAILLTPMLLAIRSRISHRFATLFLALVPCVAFVALRSAWELSHISRPSVVRGSMQRLSTEGPRVLLIVFDEMSEYVAFTHRPDGLEMPAFDQLRSEAVVANAAYPPGHSTNISMPALFTGRAIREAKPVSEYELQVRYLQSPRFESFSASSTAFSDAHALGMGTAMIGWYHPYCALLSDVDFCAHVKSGGAVTGFYDRGSISAKILDVISQRIPLLSVTDWAKQRHYQALREAHISEYLLLNQIVQDSLPKFRSGLMVIHLPIPHPAAVNAHGVYFHNLDLADRELSEIRSTMERAGTWDSSTVLITSDHWWRTHAWAQWTALSFWTASEKEYIDSDRDLRVPFIAKLPGQRTGLSYGPEFNVLVSRSLVNELFARRITTPEALKNWLDLHRKDVPALSYSQPDADVWCCITRQ